MVITQTETRDVNEENEMADHGIDHLVDDDIQPGTTARIGASRVRKTQTEPGKQDTCRPRLCEEALLLMAYELINQAFEHSGAELKGKCE